MEDKSPHTVEGVADEGKVAFARELRREATPSEELLWQALRRRQLGARFRRQHPIGDFILDFYCAEARLAVEVDGPIHATRRQYDVMRDNLLEPWGIRVLRVSDEQVQRDLAGTLNLIRQNPETVGQQ